MKKMKKILALTLAILMILGMTMTVSAATATIEVKDATGAEITYVQVIKADTTTKTGWAFASADIASAYKTAFGMAEEQAIIQAMINYEKKAGTPVATAGQIATALSNVSSIVPTVFGEKMTESKATVGEAGVYAIKAVQTGYTYSIMSAYVGFGEKEGSNYPTLMDALVNAKKTIIGVEKDNNDSDDVVAIGDVMTFTISTKIPYVDQNDTNKTYFVYDQITGATYVQLDKAIITLNGAEIAGFSLNQSKENPSTFSIDFSELIKDDNENAGAELKISYTANVNDLTVDNEASAGDNASKDRYGSDKTNAYTGKITLIKYNEDETVKLKGAGFQVTKQDSNSPLTFSPVIEKGTLVEGQYIFDPEGKITEVFTNEEGELIVQGLDVGTYEFLEKTAPEGYSVNQSSVEGTLTVTEQNGVATSIITKSISMTNTKLAALPETGGIGTTIFTIGGCLIMLLAVALFFAYRRKSMK